MAKARGLALLAVVVLAGCGGSNEPAPKRVSLRVALPLVPSQLDPAKASDLPSLNVAHELYSGLTRYSGTGVEPDLAESWDVAQGGLVWTFHLRNNLRWSDETPIVADDFRRSWRQALAPSTNAPFAGPNLGIVRGARHLHATGSGGLGVEALDDRTLRVTLQHPVPWFDELAASPVAALRPPKPTAFSGPFRLGSRSSDRLVLERNLGYWNADEVKPARVVMTVSPKGADAVLPRGLFAPGLPWVDTVGPTPAGARELQTLATGLLWLATKDSPLADDEARQYVAWVVTHLDLGGKPASLVSPAVPGAAVVNSHEPVELQGAPKPLALTVAWAREDVSGSRIAARLQQEDGQLRSFGITLSYRPVATVQELLATKSDLTLLGWSTKIFDAYNLLDVFPCGSAFNVARWCDPSYDALMRQAVREPDNNARWRIERRLVDKLHEAVPAIPVYTPVDHFTLAPGVRGFSWSPMGFYEVSGMARS